MNYLILFSISFFFGTNSLFLNVFSFDNPDFELGKKLFTSNCVVCHLNKENKIIPEKTLKKDILEANGIFNFDSIVYQITNGKNGMPAFGSKLNEFEISKIAIYLLEDE